MAQKLAGMLVLLTLLAMKIPTASAYMNGGGSDECDKDYDVCCKPCSDMMNEPDPSGDAFLAGLDCISDCVGNLDLCKIGVLPSGSYYGKFETGHIRANILRVPRTGMTTLRAGRWDGSRFIGSQGSVTKVAFYVITTQNLRAAPSFAAADWESLGVGAFNATSKRWELAWNPGGAANVRGYHFAARFYDPTLPNVPGGTPGQTVAVVPAFPTAPVPNLPEKSSVLVVLGLALAGALRLSGRIRPKVA